MATIKHHNPGHVTSVEFDHMSLLIETRGNGAHIRTGRITDCTTVCSVRPTVVRPDGKPYYDGYVSPIRSTWLKIGFSAFVRFRVAG